MYGIISFYKDLIHASKALNDKDYVADSSSQVFDIINKA